MDSSTHLAKCSLIPLKSSPVYSSQRHGRLSFSFRAEPNWASYTPTENLAFESFFTC